MSARLLNAVEVKSDLYAMAQSDGYFMLLDGNITKGDVPVTLWQYDASSMAVDNYAGGVIRPTENLVTEPGRWIRQDNFPANTTGKRQETYSGTTNSSGVYSVVYATAFPVVPNVQYNIGNGGTNKETIILTASTVNGFTVLVQARTDIIGLLPTYSPVNSRNVDVIVTAK